MSKKNAIFALEEDEVIEAPAVVETEVIPQAEAELETANTEVQEEAGDIEEVNDGVEEAAGDTEVLNEIKEILEESVEKGEGIDETAAAIVEVAVEAICGKLGVKKSRQSNIPAIESFGSTGTRLSATKIAVESIDGKIKTIWAAVQKALVAIVQRIKEFFMKFFSNTEKVVTAAKAIKEQAAAAKGTPEQSTISISAVSKGFYDPKTKAANVSAVLENQEGLTKNFLGALDLVTSAIGTFEAQLKNPAELDKDVAFKLQAVSKHIFNGLPNAETSVDEEGVTSIKTTSGPFVGGRMVVGITSDKEKPVFKISIDEVAGADKETELKALSAEEAGKLADTVIQLMATTAEYKGKQSKIDAVMKSLMGVVDTAIKLSDKVGAATEEKPEARTRTAEIRKCVSDLSLVINRMTSVLPALNVQAGKLALNYAQASLKNIKEAKAEEKTEAVAEKTEAAAEKKRVS